MAPSAVPAPASANGHVPDRIPHRVLVVGGAYAGVAAVLGLLNGLDGKPVRPVYGQPDSAQPSPRPKRPVEITLIDERDGFFHSVGAPLAHVAKGSVEPSWLRYNALWRLKRRELSIRHGTIKHINPEALSATFADYDDGSKDVTVEYDYLLLATGSRREWPIVPKASSFKNYVIEAQKHIAGIEVAKSSTVAVIGGGAVGIEFAGEIKSYHPHNRVILIHSRDELLSNEPLPAEFKTQALSSLEETGIEVVLGQRANVTTEDGFSRITLTDGRVINAGYVFPATSRFSPNTESLPRDAVDENGYVKVTSHMTLKEIANPDRHFAAGDICHWSGIKRAGPAMVMGHVAAANIFNDILKKEDPLFEVEAAEFPEVAPMMALAVGSSAITYHPDKGVMWGPERYFEIPWSV
ncbi:fad nad-binding domain-containing protein [Neofusicoccum parvum]|uniref:Fad nad-binding domain-containing protein n=2 Tax=Neofusicoccum parvum TaxID=310453 RepID=A0ACB5SIN0_9PEZI|nr:putative pyridine nucleotide-disulfide oxidoreductase amid- protein [Neofusicoccum parvum UCRNP2]GME41266.1 fad nad-binding domain-containing protein [Neofusicoccum parvum]GME47670.1 fad nad-binding domain-containing protein [Neofusicoccum parvum]